jgi:hypothetical protein
MNTNPEYLDTDNHASGYSVGKWSDDDDWHPITPFRGALR